MAVLIISVFIIIAVAAAATFAMTSLKGRGGSSAGKKNKAAIIREASKRLAQNPNDSSALLMAGDIYYQDQDWEKTYASYAPLLDQMRSRTPSEQFEISSRYGMSALKTNRLDEAKKGFLLAKNVEPNHFEVNYNLGYIYYMQKDYEKAVPFLRKALVPQPDNIAALKYLAYTLQSLRKYQEALPCLKKVLDVQPDNKEALFAMGECFYEVGSNEQALKIFTHLRVSPDVGPRSALYAGLIRIRANQLDKAAEDFEIGLKHENIPMDINNELRYNLAQARIKTQDLQKALVQLKEIQSTSPGYKDVASLILRYQELNQNKNLHMYLMAGQSEFVGLCRKIVSRFFPNAKVKILDISVLATHTDIVAEIDTPKWADLVIFRFFRSQGSVGELVLRDFHGRIKEMKAGKGICMTAGTFTEEARRFTEGRPLDLFDKNRLNKVLNAIG
ncbi:MAG: tetratricopeptide repeat protein [Treponema sp.]